MTLSVFLAVLLMITIAGWSWTTQHQTAWRALASHVVLAASALAGCGGFVLWEPRDGRGEAARD